MNSISSEINIKVVNNTSLPQPVSILGVVPNSNSASNNNMLYEYNFSGQSYVGVTSITAYISITSNPSIIPYSASVLSQNIQGVVNALNSLNQGLFSYSGTTIYVSSNYYIYDNISFSGSSVFGTTGGTPIGITIDSSGNIYTANFLTNNVSKITPLGVSTILGTTSSAPTRITIDSAGNVYTTTTSDNVNKITPLGVSTILGTTGSSPQGITIDSAGNVYTANAGSNNVSKITPLGVSTILGTTGTNPSAITIDSAGNIYTANANSNNVSKITPLGVSTILGTTDSVPVAITIDSVGNIYTSNSNSNNVTIIVQ
jgi:streptogramin lyase